MVPLRAEALQHRLRDLGVATPQQIEIAKQQLAASQEPLSAILVSQGLLRDVDMARRLAGQLGCLPQRWDGARETTPRADRVPEAIWKRHRVIPIRERDGTLLAATDDPLTVFAADFFAGQCGCAIELVLVPTEDLNALLQNPPPRESSSIATPPSGSAPSASSVAAPQPSASAQAPSRASPPPAVAQAPQPVSAANAPPAASAPAVTPKIPEKKKSPAAAAQGAQTGVKDPKAQAKTAAEPAANRPSAEGRPPENGANASGVDEPIIQLVDSMLAEAVRMRASDIHVEPATQRLRVRYRIDGVLHDVNSPPKALQGPVVSRIKIMAGLNIAEKRLPQDGRLQMSVEQRPLDVRVSVLPSSHGESIVMRLLDRSQPVRGLADMGVQLEDQRQWDELIHRPHGMVLVTGPTGSGKTTTLYGALSVLNQPDRKLITIEDPVEYQLSGINQVLVRASIGLTFAAGLRSMLRQAPDVIMVGEIRDQETAQIAIQAALTGHLVLSTLHTNDAPSAVTRLIDMGIAPFLTASTIQGVLAQRLIRRICASCRELVEPTAEERAFLGEDIGQVARGAGCEACHGSGFLGRIGLFELLMVTEPVRQLIVTRPSASAIRQAALAEGMRTLQEDGRLKIREGLTTMTEVLRVVAEGEA